MKLYGRNPVLERLRSNPKSIRKIFVQENQADLSYIYKKVGQHGIPVHTVPRSKMLKMSHSLNTQGILAEIEDFAYTPYEELLEQAVKNKESLIFLDNLNDPQNLGAIMRSLACLGGFSIVLPAHESVEVTEAVLRVSSGGDNFISVAKVSNLSHAILSAKRNGFWIAGTVVEGGQDLTETSLPFPVSLVVGSEQKGLREAIKKHVDLLLTLPMRRQRLSLNVAQATTIFCYEITRQRKKVFDGERHKKD